MSGSLTRAALVLAVVLSLAGCGEKPVGGEEPRDSGTFIPVGDSDAGGQGDGGLSTGGGSGSDGGAGTDGGFTNDGGFNTDGGIGSDGGIKFDGGFTNDGGFSTDGGIGGDGGIKTDGGFSTDGGIGSDGGIKTDGGFSIDGGIGSDGGSTTDAGTGSDAGIKTDGGSTADAGSGLGQPGDAGFLVLDVLTHDVGGTVLLNGAQPTSTCASSDRASVKFVDSNLGYTFTFAVPCNGATTPFNFAGKVYAGTYRVTVTGGNSTVPSQPYVIATALTVSSAQTSMILDVRTHNVAGTVTMNNLQPTSTCASSDRASVRFTDNALGYDFTFAVPCNGATTPFNFSGAVYPGTYRVTVTGGNSTLPSQPYVVHSSFAISAPQPSMVLDVVTHNLSGTVTLNGGQPTSTCASSDRASVRFVDSARGYSFTFAVPCNGATTPFTWSGVVFPGTYRVTVTGGNSTLPSQPYVIDTALAISTARSGLLFDVRTIALSGTVLLNGQRPSSTCASSDRASVRFLDASLGYDFTFAVPCNGATTAFDWSGSVFPGTYRVTVTGGNSTLPAQPYVITTALPLVASPASLTFDVVTHAVSGTVLQNGAQPSSGCASSDRASVRFVDTDLGYSFTFAVPCNGGTTPFNWSGSLFPGTYRVTVTGGNSTLPSQPYVIDLAYSVSSPRPNLSFNVLTYVLRGRVLLNGAQPTSTCASSDRATITFTDAVRGYTFTFYVPCNGATTPFDFIGTLFPGNYRVTVTGGNSTVPSQPYVALTSFVVP